MPWDQGGESYPEFIPTLDRLKVDRVTQSPELSFDRTRLRLPELAILNWY
jgi:hypothetical protein